MHEVMTEVPQSCHINEQLYPVFGLEAGRDVHRPFDGSLHVSEYNSVAGNGEQFRADENNCLGKRVRNRVLNKARLQKVSRALDLMENTPSPT